MKTALFIGRFQPFHKGHLWAIQKILSENDLLKIGIGSSQFRDEPQNPFSAQERKEMIERTLDKEFSDAQREKISFYFISDIFDDSRWVGHVMDIIGEADLVYTGSLLTEKLFEKAGKTVVRLPRHEEISASEIRLRIVLGKPGWKEMMPECALVVFTAIEGEKRIKALRYE